MKPSLWAAIAGGLLIASTVYQGANAVTHPTHLPLVNIAIGVTNILYIVFGALLIGLFLKNKQKEDAGVAPLEGDALLKRRTAIIFGFVLLWEILASVGSYIINDYSVGLSLVNLAVLDDILFNVILAYLMVELFMGKRDVFNYLFYTILLYTISQSIITLLRGHWYGVLLGIFFGIYFLYGIKAPVNRKNFRITHYILLPLFLILSLGSAYFDNGNIEPLGKNEALLEAQFSNQSDSIATAYSRILDSENPSKIDMQDLTTKVTAREQKIDEIVKNIAALQAEYKLQFPSVGQVVTIEQYKNLIALIEINREQGRALVEFMDYLETVDFATLTDAQKVKIKDYISKVDSFVDKLTEKQFEFQDQNLPVE